MNAPSVAGSVIVSPTKLLEESCKLTMQDKRTTEALGWTSAFRLVSRSASLPVQQQDPDCALSSPLKLHLPAFGQSLSAPSSSSPDQADKHEYLLEAVEKSFRPQTSTPSALKGHSAKASDIESLFSCRTSGSVPSMSVGHRRPSMSCSEDSFDGSSVLCQVCGDKASGFHYGVHACEGCKGFFRRSIQQKIQYRPCSKNQQCSVLRINRNRCQYCRLKKCIAVGMSRDAVRFGRVPKREKAKILAEMQRANAHSQATNMAAILEDGEQVVASVVSAFLETKVYFKSRSLPLLQVFHERRFLLRPSSTACPLHLGIATTMDVNNQELTDSYLPAIRAIVNFAKNIPGFLVLPWEDQIVLLKAGVFELLLLQLSSLFDTSTKSLVLLNGSVYQRGGCPSQGNGLPGANRFLIDSLFDFVDHFNMLQMTDVELALFSAIVLVSSSRPGLKNAELVDKLKDRLKQLLQQIIFVQHGGDLRLFNTLMLKIPDLRTLNTLHAENLLINNFDSQDKRSRAADPNAKKSKAPAVSSSSDVNSTSLPCGSDEERDSFCAATTSAVRGSPYEGELLQELSQSTDVDPKQWLVDLSKKTGRSSTVLLAGNDGPLEALNLKVVHSPNATVKANMHSPIWPTKDNTSFDSGKGSLSANESYSSNDSLSEHHMEDFEAGKGGTGVICGHKPLGLSASLDQARMNLREQMPTLKQALQTPPLFSLPKVARTCSYNEDDRGAAGRLRDKHVCLASLLEKQPAELFSGKASEIQGSPQGRWDLKMKTNSTVECGLLRTSMPCNAQWANVFNTQKAAQTVSFDSADALPFYINRSAPITSTYMPLLNDPLLHPRVINSLRSFLGERLLLSTTNSALAKYPLQGTAGTEMSQTGVNNAGSNEWYFLQCQLAAGQSSALVNTCNTSATVAQCFSPKREFPVEPSDDEPLNLSKKATPCSKGNRPSGSSTSQQQHQRQSLLGASTVKIEPSSTFTSA